MTKKYATRTCVNCGIRKPQPYMVQKEITYKSGNSKRGVTGATWAGYLLGQKKAERAVHQTLFNTQQRNYYRKRKVWMCPECASQYKDPKQDNVGGKIGEFIILTIIAGIVLLVFGGG